VFSFSIFCHPGLIFADKAITVVKYFIVQTHGACNIKLFMNIIAAAFATSIYFHPNLMFVGKAITAVKCFTLQTDVACNVKLFMNIIAAVL